MAYQVLAVRHQEASKMNPHGHFKKYTFKQYFPQTVRNPAPHTATSLFFFDIIQPGYPTKTVNSGARWGLQLCYEPSARTRADDSTSLCLPTSQVVVRAECSLSVFTILTTMLLITCRLLSVQMGTSFPY